MQKKRERGSIDKSKANEEAFPYNERSTILVTTDAPFFKYRNNYSF